MTYYRNFFSWRFMLQLQWDVPLNFSVTWQWSNFFIIIINEFLTNPESVTILKLFFFFTHGQIFVKVFVVFVKVFVCCLQYSYSLKLVSSIFIKSLFLTTWQPFQNYEKYFLFHLTELFSLSRYSNFCICVFPSFSPCQPLVVCNRQNQDTFSHIYFSNFNHFKKVHTQIPHIFLQTPQNPYNTFSY